MSRISAASGLFGLAAQNIQPVPERGQRIAQFVRQRGQKLILAPVGLLQRLGLRLQRVALGGDLLALAIEFEKHVGLAAQNIGFDRLVDEIDRAGLIAAETALRVGVAGGDENDRNMAGALVAAHQLGQFEAVQARHLHVDQRQRDVVLQQKLKRLVAGARLQQHQARRGAASASSDRRFSSRSSTSRK